MSPSEFFNLASDLGFDADTLKSGGLVSLSSSNLAAFGYAPLAKVLTIEFTSGSMYLYKGVPANVALELMQAGSHGSFFHHNIRTSYPFQRL